jgi:hypothetical protein
MKKNSNLAIYTKNLKTKSKLISFNKRKNDSGKVKFLPPYFEEWNNTTYSYNKNQIKNIPLYNTIINKIIKSYFNLLFLNSDFITPKKRRLFLKDIYLSDAKIRYTNSKAKITLYTVNFRKYFFTKYINYFYYYFVEKEWKEILNEKKPFSLIKLLKSKYLRFIGIETIFSKNNSFFASKFLFNNLERIKNTKDILNIKFRILNKGLESYNLFKKIHLTKEIKHIYSKYLMILYKYNYLYLLNNIKFNTANISFVNKLKEKLSLILNKKIELNIINLKSITYNTDIFTKALAIKLKKRRFNVIKSLISIINRGNIITRNYSYTESLLKNRNLDLLENKFKDFSLISILNSNNNFNNFLKNIYSSLKSSNTNISNSKLNDLIFTGIKYKNLGGIRLEVKGRLTKRYRADRAIYKLHWKGGLKNIDSSLKRLSSVMFRGNLKSNVTYSIYKSKRRIGSFAVKGWISGK